MATLSDLTPRELEVLQLVLAGWTNKAIAAEIHICEKTVEFHLDNVYTKIGMRTRTLACLWAVHHGVSTLEAEKTLAGLALLKAKRFARHQRRSN
jgi:two-component system, NarL family, response regulator